MDTETALIVLGLSDDATEDDINKAFREKSMLYHPDKRGGNIKLFQKLVEARDCLLLTQKKCSSIDATASDASSANTSNDSDSTYTPSESDDAPIAPGTPSNDTSCSFFRHFRFKSLLTYQGSKRRQVPFLRKLLPKTAIDNYVECFFGGGSMFFDLAPRRAILGDLQPQVIEFHKAIKHGHRVLIHDYFNPREVKARTLGEVLVEQYNKLEDDGEESLLERAKLIYTINKLAFQGKFRYVNGRLNPTWNRKTFFPRTASELLDKRLDTLFENVEIYQLNYASTMSFSDTPTTFCFLDPPYYQTDMTAYNAVPEFTEAHHEELSQIFKSSRMKCMLVVNDIPLMRRLYDGYIHSIISSHYGATRKLAIHLVILNYDPTDDTDKVFTLLDTPTDVLYIGGGENDDDNIGNEEESDTTTDASTVASRTRSKTKI